MRIARVMLGFFAVGFLAASFERAAGLGHIDRVQHGTSQVGSAAAPRETSAPASAHGVRVAAAAIGEVGHSLPPDPVARPRLWSLDAPAARQAVAAALAAAAEAVGYQSLGLEKDSRYFDLAQEAIPRLAAYKRESGQALLAR
jgi:hypothetical protein